MTPPLSEDYTSLWDRYEKAIQFIWKKAFGFVLEPWQCALLRRILETYPPGHARAGELRFRQVVLSMPRQQGKTELAAVLGLIGLLREKSPLVIGIASSREQSALVYKRTLQAIASNPALASKFKRLTDTRGIQSKTGGLYELKAAKGAALQGLPISTGVVDEVHLLKSDLWQALVNGMGARPNTIVVGITTAGGIAESELLVELYKAGDKAIAGDETLERFGFFCYQAPEDRVPDNDAELLEFLYACTPALASGRLDAQTLLSDIRAMPEPDIIRYRLNCFTASLNPFLPIDRWKACEAPPGYVFPSEGPLVFTFDMTPENSYASVTATRKTSDGILHSELVAWFVQPTDEQLIRVAERLWKHSPAVYAGENYKLGPMLTELKRRGYPVHIVHSNGANNAAALLYARVMQRRFIHAGDPLLDLQMPRAVRKNFGESYRINRASSSVEIDAVLATAFGAYVCEQQQELPIQVF